MRDEKFYGYTGRGSYEPPDFDRVVRSLTLEELEDEIMLERGEPEYRRAALGELERRQKLEAAESPAQAAPSAHRPSERPRGRS